jgi:cation diffusion facilitator CzcD-associated flavoprotein CzcO
MTTSTDVLVLGAGPYGLSAYAHLKRHRLRTRIFGEPMRTWRSHMPDGMFLKSTPEASSIAAGRAGYNLDDYCRAVGAHMPGEHEAVPLDLFTDYGLWFAERLAPEVEQTEVTSIARDGANGFAVETAAGEQFGTRTVVVASGLIGHAFTPPELDGAQSAAAGATATAASGTATSPALTRTVSHSSEHTDLSVFAGRDVAVVGAGQSSLESAALLAEAGARPTIVVRKPGVVFAGSPFDPSPSGPLGLYARIPKPQGPLGPGWPLLAVAKGPAAFRQLPDAARLSLVARVLGPAGAWWLRERVEGRVPIRTRHEVVGTSADGDGVRLHLAGPNGAATTLRADHVIAATGYRIGPDSFPFLSPDLRAALARVNHWPRLGPGYQSSIPGLYFVGFPSAASFGPLMRFVCGTGYASPRVTHAARSLVRG